MDRSVLERKSVPELRDIAAALEMTGTTKLRKAELIDAILGQAVAGSGDGANAPEAADSGRDGGERDGGGGDAAESVDADDGSGADLDSDSDDDVEDADDADDADDDDDADDSDRASRRDGGRSGSRRTRTRSRESSRRQADGGGADSTDADDDDDEDDGAGRGGRNRGRRDGGRGRGGKQRDRDGGAPNDGGGRRDAGSNPRNDKSDSDSSGGKDGNRNKNRGGKGNNQSDDGPGEIRAGVLDILPEGYGFLRTTGYLPGERDVYVSQGQIRKQRLRRGDVVQGPIRHQRSNEKVPALHHVERVNLEELESGQVADRPEFDTLTAIPVVARIDLGAAESVTARAMDLVAPQADGQRTVITVPPAVDGAALLIELAAELTAVRPESHLMFLTVDARPEVVTLATGSVDGEIIASTFEQPAEDHTQIAELAMERAKRLVELGHDVIVLVDSLSRLARAYGVAGATGGRTVAPDVEAAALYPPKQLMAAARATDGHGSLTIIATLLTGTGSSYDDVVEREFVRIANSIVTTDADLATMGARPGVSVLDSQTYLASSVQTDDEVTRLADLRRSLRTADTDEATMEVMNQLQATLTGEAGSDR